MMRKPAKFCGDTSYGVELIDTNGAEDVFISRKLIECDHAVLRKLNALVSQ